MTPKSLPTLFELTPLNEDYRANPHVLLDDLRARCPVHRDETSGTFILTRHADVRRLVTDRAMWRDPARAEDAASTMKALARDVVDGFSSPETTSILLLDDPAHQRIRRPLNRAFYARIAKSHPLVERIVDEANQGRDDEQKGDAGLDGAQPQPAVGPGLGEQVAERGASGRVRM